MKNIIKTMIALFCVTLGTAVMATSLQEQPTKEEASVVYAGTFEESSSNRFADKILKDTSIYMVYRDSVEVFSGDVVSVVRSELDALSYYSSITSGVTSNKVCFITISNTNNENSEYVTLQEEVCKFAEDAFSAKKPIKVFYEYKRLVRGGLYENFIIAVQLASTSIGAQVVNLDGQPVNHLCIETAKKLADYLNHRNAISPNIPDNIPDCVARILLERLNYCESDVFVSPQLEEMVRVAKAIINNI